MPLHRVTICLNAPLGTPLTSGTIFGHLCWAVRDSDGNSQLERWLSKQKEKPWALSDGFPAGYFPKPLLRGGDAGGEVAQSTNAADRAKERGRRAWLPVRDFLELRRRASRRLLDAALDRSREPPGDSEIAMAHNTIDRRLGQTPETGGLYFMDELWPSAERRERDIYVDADAGSAEIERLFAHVGEHGYGRDSTYGRGSFTVGRVETADELRDHAGNRRMSLSHGSLSANMIQACYRLFTHFGKLGARAAAEGNRAWKRPIVLMRPGATFEPTGDGPFGAMLHGVHQDDQRVIHNAVHLSIPYTEVVGSGT